MPVPRAMMKLLAYAIRLFETIEEQRSFDPVKNGYCEALTREWGRNSRYAPQRQGMRTRRKTMNTPSAYSGTLYQSFPRVEGYPSGEATAQFDERLFTEWILNIKTGHLELFFNDDWVSKCRIVSYGHDIEASWLIHEGLPLFWAMGISWRKWNHL